MELHDNGKLVHYLQSHGIRIISVQPQSITVEAVYTKDGAVLTQAETVQATLPAIREWLGY